MSRCYTCSNGHANIQESHPSQTDMTPFFCLLYLHCSLKNSTKGLSFEFNHVAHLHKTQVGINKCAVCPCMNLFHSIMCWGRCEYCCSWDQCDRDRRDRDHNDRCWERIHHRAWANAVSTKGLWFGWWTCSLTILIKTVFSYVIGCFLPGLVASPKSQYVFTQPGHAITKIFGNKLCYLLK